MGHKKTEATETPVEAVAEDPVATNRPGRMPLPETQALIDKIVEMVTEAGEEGVTNIAIAQALEIGTLKASSLGTRLVRQGVLQMSKAENGRTAYYLAEETTEA